MTEQEMIELRKRYDRAAHRMQSVILTRLGIERDDNVDPDKRETGGKHLRVGVNNALRDQSSLVRLLIEKGVFTEEEYTVAVVEGMESEAEMQVRAFHRDYPHLGKVTFA